MKPINRKKLFHRTRFANIGMGWYLFHGYKYSIIRHAGMVGLFKFDTALATPGLSMAYAPLIRIMIGLNR